MVDFGTGTGTYAIELARARPDLRVIALDEHQAMLDKLQAKLVSDPLENLELVLARTPAARTLEGTVDRVLGLNVLALCPHQERVEEEEQSSISLGDDVYRNS